MITEVKLIEQPKLDVLGVVAESERINVNEVINQGSQDVFLYRPQMGQRLGVADKQTGVDTDENLNNYNRRQGLVFRAKMNEYGTLLSQASPQQDVHDEENRLLMADVFLRFAGSPDHDIGYIDANYGHLPFVINPITNPVVEAINLFEYKLDIKNMVNAELYLLLLSKMAQQIDQVKEHFVSEAQQGWLPPKTIIDASKSKLATFAEPQTDKHILYRQLQHKLDSSSLTKDEQQQLLQQAAKIISEKLQPAYQKIIDSLAHYRHEAPTAIGLSTQATGKELYQYVLVQQLNTNLDAEQIHQLGVTEVNRLTTDIDSILTRLGYVQGSVASRLKALATEARFATDSSNRHANTENKNTVLNDQSVAIEARNIVPLRGAETSEITDVVSLIADTNDKLHDYFNVDKELHLTISSVSEPIASIAPLINYQPAFIHGDRPANLVINKQKLSLLPAFRVSTMIHKQTVPGQHWQHHVQLQQTHVPNLRLLVPYQAFIQGWALYAERVAYKMGMYEHNPYGNLGRLQSELLASALLVIDTGIHSQQWDEDKAINYLIDQVGITRQEARQHVTYCIALPGQALAAKIGMLRIIGLRDYAKSVLNRRFNISTFHDMVLQNGALPLPMLDTYINYWISGE
ncbi:DUF885 family protein [Thalassotalea maritima]|uniref:DUF885 domain-containing protein n=1 Tax=Thalassotalea maritima TaxID=3242416 RepID=UPI0035280284